MTNRVRLRITCDVDSIDCVTGSFVAEGWVTFECKVREGTQDEVISRDDPRIRDGNLLPFIPGSLFKNSIDFVESDSTYEIRSDYLRGYIGYKATLTMVFDYSSLPFDKNVLAIQLQSNPAFVQAWSNRQYEHLPIRAVIAEHDWFWNHDDGDYPNDASFFGLSQALIHQWELATPQIDFLNLEFLMPVGRKPFFIALNFMFPLFCITSLVAVAFAFDVRDLDKRLTVVLTLLLSALAFRVAIYSSLPAINHLTLLDKYILISTLLMSATASEMTLVYNYVSVNTAVGIDKLFFFVVTAIWLFVNLALFFATAFPGIITDSWDGSWKRYADIRDKLRSRYAYVDRVFVGTVGTPS
jgi:hypothetical protein